MYYSIHWVVSIVLKVFHKLHVILLLIIEYLGLGILCWNVFHCVEYLIVELSPISLSLESYNWVEYLSLKYFELSKFEQFWVSLIIPWVEYIWEEVRFFTTSSILCLYFRFPPYMILHSTYWSIWPSSFHNAHTCIKGH